MNGRLILLRFAGIIVLITALSTGVRQAVAAEKEPDGEPVLIGPDFSTSNTVSLVLGEEDRGHGLQLILNQRDGQTTVEGADGLPARKAVLTGTRTSLYYYFALDPSFKEQDVKRVRIDVEYFPTTSGNLGIHYDGKENEDSPDSTRYREANNPIYFTASRTWQKATFYTRNDANFKNRQNGRSDFRIWAKARELYVRKVTVTRAPLDDRWVMDYSKSNQVSINLGEEKDTDGLRHPTEEKDGQTTIVSIEGVPSRYLNRVREGRAVASLYFQISPSFKRAGLKNARIEVEYLSRTENALRLQFDGMKDGVPYKYLPVLAKGAAATTYGNGADYSQISVVGSWQTAVFHVTNAVFMNAQKNGADFRIEVAPPELYVRRVTVFREGESK